MENVKKNDKCDWCGAIIECPGMPCSSANEVQLRGNYYSERADETCKKHIKERINTI